MNQILKEFINMISPYLENKDQTHYQALAELINSVNNWFPQVTDNYQHCGNNTTNRIEGEFGVLKNRTSHEILSLVDIISTLKVRHDELALSRTKNNLLNDLIIPDTLMDKNESNQLGRIINIQYGTCEDLIARHKLYTYSRTLARRYNTISVTHPLYS